MESNTLSRRYELPTCLLEISTERSPLSDWQSQIVAQNLHFRLQLTNTKKVIKGNQQQITNLIEVVTAYCDRWLAQDDFETLNHAIAVPKLTKLKLSTLQLFDLYESLELCASEFVILPNLVLEVRRLNPNWLKLIAGAIAIVGVSIGTIRLISPPFGDQPSYQLASTPAASHPEKASISPSTSSKDTSESKSGITASPKPSNQANTTNPSISAAKPNAAIAPTAPIPSPTQKDLNRDFKSTERVDKVAIATDPSISKPITRQREIDNSPAVSGAVTESRRLESPNPDALSQPSTVTAESSKPSPSAPSTKSPIPSSASRADNENIGENIGATRNTGNLKVLQIQSELPSDITTALVRYIQAQPITTTAGTIAFELEISGDRIINISADSQGSTLKDNNAIAELEKLILNWRSPNPVTGKIRLVLQL